MTAQGSAWTRMRRALDHDDAYGAMTAAAELPDVALSDALELVLLLARKDPTRHRLAALRWTARYSREVRGVEPEEAQAVLALLLMLGGRRNGQAARALSELLGDRTAFRRHVRQGRCATRPHGVASRTCSTLLRPCSSRSARTCAGSRCCTADGPQRATQRLTN